MKNVLVFDIGGTYFRYAVVKGGRICCQEKKFSPSFYRFPAMSDKELINSLMADISGGLADSQRRKYKISTVVLAVPGIVTKDGTVVAAPPLWGSAVRNVQLKKMVEEKFGIKVIVVNDLIGTALYYASLPGFCASADFMMLITLSTGIGCKAVDLKRQNIVTGSNGLGGEIGHVVIDDCAGALLCDCGGRGHLASYLSGRGIARLIRSFANISPYRYKRSKIDSEDESQLIMNFVKALKRGDPFANDVMTVGIDKFANLIEIISGSMGIDRYVLVGSVAFALGDILKSRLTKRLLDVGIFGWSDEKIKQLVKIGADNDNFGLIGAAKYAVALK